MMAAPRERLKLVEKKPQRPLAERGKVLFVEDIQALYGRHPIDHPTAPGQWRKSRKWVFGNFAPDVRHKDGRDVWWWETDALAWMDTQREGAE